MTIFLLLLLAFLILPWPLAFALVAWLWMGR